MIESTTDTYRRKRSAVTLITSQLILDWKKQRNYHQLYLWEEIRQNITTKL